MAGMRHSKHSLDYSVFISHSSYDSWIARMIAEKITRAGAEPWLDVLKLEGGVEIRKEILRGIRACREVIVLVTPESLKSQWVSFEIGAAYALGKRVTPVLHYSRYDELKTLNSVKAVELGDIGHFRDELRNRIQQAKRQRR